MAETTTSGPSNGLYFIVGGLVVAVVIAGFAYQQGYLGAFGGRTTVEKTVTTPSVDGAGTTTTTTKTTP